MALTPPDTTTRAPAGKVQEASVLTLSASAGLFLGGQAEALMPGSGLRELVTIATVMAVGVIASYVRDGR